MLTFPSAILDVVIALEAILPAAIVPLPILAPVIIESAILLASDTAPAANLAPVT